MSEQAPERPGRAAAPRAGSTGGGNILMRKFGGFPVWVYLAVLGGLLAWRYFAGKSTAATSTSSGTDTSGTGMTDASQVPQFVNQTFATVSPPSAPGSVSTRPARLAGKVKQFSPPTGLKATGETRNGVTLTWNTVPAGSVYPASYTVEVFNAKGKPVSTTTVDTPDAIKGQGTTTLTGLKPKMQYHANVWANGGLQAPQHATIPFKTAA